MTSITMCILPRIANLVASEAKFDLKLEIIYLIIPSIVVQGTRKKYAFFAKQDPGRAR